MLAVVASANGNTAGYGALNPALYQLAQQSPGTYLNDVTSGNNDYNATDGGQYPAMSGYDMATGLGTPVASELAAGLHVIPLDVAVSGTQTYGGSPTFTASANYAGSGAHPSASRSTPVASAAPTSARRRPSVPPSPPAAYTLVASSCSGLTLSGADAADYSVVYTSAANDFTVSPAPVDIAVSGTQTYGGTPTFIGRRQPPLGHHREPHRVDLHRGRHIDDHHADPARRQRHPAGLLVQRCHPVGHQRRRTTASSTPVRRGTSR